MTRLRLPVGADWGRRLVLAAVVLTFASAIVWLRLDPDPAYDLAHGTFEAIFGVALALCALPLLSRRHRRALAILAAILLLTWCVLVSYFGGLINFPEVVVLFLAAAQRRPAAKPTRRQMRSAHEPT